MRFAFETVLWGRRIDDLELVLDIIAAGGFTGVEIAQRPEDLFLRNPDPNGEPRKLRDIHELLRLLEARKLTLVSLAGGPLNSRVKFCREFRPEFLYIEQWDDDAERAATLPQPFVLGLHPHWFMSVHRMSQVHKILKTYREKYPEGRQLRVLPDTAHLTIVGDDPVQAVQEFAENLAGLHLKDWLPAYGRYSHRYAQGFAPLGEGIVKLKAVLDRLKELKPDAWVVVEQDYDPVSPARCVAKCVNWLVKQWQLPTPPTEIFENLFQRETQAPAPLLPPETALREVKFLREISQKTLAGSSSFYQATVNALFKLGDLSAVQLYGYNARNEELYLLGMAGLEGLVGTQVLKANDPTSLCGLCTRSQHILQYGLAALPTDAQFDSPHLLQHLPVQRMVVVPIFNPSNSHHLRFLLKLFPNSATAWRNERELMQLGVHLARMADHVTDDVCSAAASLTSYHCGSKSSREDFCQRFVELVKELFHCEGVSLFLVNDLGDKLELAGTTGLTWRSSLARQECYYRKSDGKTGEVWATEELQIVIGPPAPQSINPRSWETNCSPYRDECLFAPLARAGSKVSGVIRLTNKCLPSSTRASTVFTDDDAAELDAMIQAALPHLDNLATRDRQISALKRMVHEFHMPLVAINGGVDFMQHTLKQKQMDPKELFGEDYLTDARHWCELMGSLADNARLFASNTGAEVLRTAPTLLLADVIAPAVAQCRKLLANRKFQEAAIRFGEFAQLPGLYVDREKMQRVFFNLLSNAIKFARPGSFRVEIESRRMGTYYLITFSDSGMGINPAEDELIFQSGYRAEEAMRHAVAGQGLGLFMVRNIIAAHGGRIKVISHRTPTTFEIALPEALRYKPPATHTRPTST